MAQRIDALSVECEECRDFNGKVNQLSTLFASSSLHESGRKEYDAILARMTHHLYQRHRLVVGHHYTKRFVSMAAIVGVGLIGLGYILFIAGVTVVVLTISVPALFGRLAISYLAGLYLDCRAKNRGTVI